MDKQSEQKEENMTKKDIQRVLELALEYYKLEVFGTGKESENPNQERIDWIYDRMKEEQVNRPKLSDNLEEAAEEYDCNAFINECMENGVCDDYDLSGAFKAGAEWMAGQGASFNTKVGWIDGPTILDWPDDILDKFEMGDEVIVQIRKK